MSTVLALCAVVCACSSTVKNATTTTTAATTITATSATTAVANIEPSNPATSAPATTAPSLPSAVTTATATTGPTPTQAIPPSTSTPDESTTTPTTVTQGVATTTASTPGRPYDVFVPTSYSAANPMPLVILLHGYGASGVIQEAYFKLQPLAESKGFLYVHPDGTKDPTGRQFWNATEACCNFGQPKVDDSGYIAGIIAAVRASYNVDPKRIFLVGHSNGAFMSYRMACDHADLVAAIVSLAGATFDDPAECKPSQPVSILEIHGTADETITFDGGQNLGNAYPSAATTVSTWAGYDGCAAAPAATSTRLDLVTDLPGKETTVDTSPGCPSGVAVELWSVAGGHHIPALSSSFAGDVVDFLFAHPKP